MIRQQVQSILTQEMDRKHFLAYVGTAVLGIVGVSGLVNVLLGSHRSAPPQAHQLPEQASGYGSTSYGE